MMDVIRNAFVVIVSLAWLWITFGLPTLRAARKAAGRPAHRQGPPRRMPTHPPAAPNEEARLDQPAKVGCTEFGRGVPWRLVVECAQRQYRNKGPAAPASAPNGLDMRMELALLIRAVDSAVSAGQIELEPYLECRLAFARAASATGGRP